MWIFFLVGHLGTFWDAPVAGDARRRARSQAPPGNTRLGRLRLPAGSEAEPREHGVPRLRLGTRGRGSEPKTSLFFVSNCVILCHPAGSPVARAHGPVHFVCASGPKRKSKVADAE